MKKFCKNLLALLLMAVVMGMTAASYVRADGTLTRYDPQAEGIYSGCLCVDQEAGVIAGITPGMTLEQLNKLSLPGDLTADAELIATGTVLTSADANQSLVAVVTGDVNGDGKITISDMLMIKTHVLGTELTGVAVDAGDVNGDGKLSMSDYLMVKTYLLGTDVPFALVQPKTATLILAPGETVAWGQTGTSYITDKETLLQISAEGLLTAGTEEGASFVYALDENENVTARMAVTVVEGGLQVSLDQAAYSVSMEQSIQLGAKLNYPVSSVFTWETDDPAICTVTPEGVLTGHAYGDTVVRVTLPNGTSAEADVKVMPPITEMKTERTLYKVKPGASKSLGLTMTPAENGEQIIWTSSDPSIATVDGSGNVTGVTKGTVTVTATGKYSGLTATCSVKVCNVIQVAITFDDGPSKHTPKLLDYLKEADIKATFFVVGNRINSFKATTKRIVDEGHELAYHSYSHKNHKNMTTEKIQSDFEKSCDIVEELTGATFTLWRAPGGNINDRVLNAIDLPHIKWTVDTLDWKYRNVDHVYNTILKNTGDGEIILLHDLHKTSVEGAIKAMKVMQAGDYEFLTVTELLSRDGEAPQPNKSYNKSPKRTTK